MSRNPVTSRKAKKKTPGIIHIQPENSREESFDLRKKFKKKFDYEVFNYAFCTSCVYYCQSESSMGSGHCLRMKNEGAYSGVEAQATCNAFLSSKGTDIDGKKVDPTEFPKHVLVQIFDDNSIHLWRHDLGQKGLPTYGGMKFLEGVGAASEIFFVK